LVEFDETKLTDELIAQILDKYSNQFQCEKRLYKAFEIDAINVIMTLKKVVLRS
jgi:type III restriction enzyme